ncbi:erythromycin esterase family protein [Amycolatopsis anabasis]|uniref:erythromycin esterase family protein n=1 Tax=Amycolatopsis anabasis TaxID=1840409 RepID=UPI00131D4588|nr:erythromycin esterase family protein [Amycolatopsis anabasis]
MSITEFAEPFAELEPLAELIGDARIVAIGENNHHIAEFGALRDRLLRFLVRDLGFGVLGFESGFAEGRLVDEWIRGGPGAVAEIGRDGVTFSLGESDEMHAMLTWLREHHAAGGDIRYAGLDVPSSGGSGLPALHAVREYLETVDPAAVPLADRAIAATEPYAGASSAVAPGRYAALEPAARDAATAALAVLLQHLDSLAPMYRPKAEHAIARHHALGALRVDAYLRELDDLANGRAPAVQSASRDAYMAATVRLLRDLLGADRRLVIMVHNGHLQRVPCRLLPTLTAPLLGSHLADEFGPDYFTLALTAGTGTTTGLAPAPDARLGFRVYEEKLGEPEPGSVEAALAGRGPSLVDLRAARARGIPGPERIRHAHMYSEVDVVQAFDALVYLPEMHASRKL